MSNIKGISKKKGGRPSKYDPKYCDQMIDYFDKPAVDEKGKARDPIYISAFAREIGVHIDTMLEWAKKHPEFKKAYRTAKQLQMEMIITNALQNRYNASFAWRAMMNMHGWRDRSDNEHTVAMPPKLKVIFGKSKKRNPNRTS